MREAVCIKQMANLNKRDEFAMNELIGMKSSKYIWDEDIEKRKLSGEKISKMYD